MCLLLSLLCKRGNSQSSPGKADLCKRDLQGSLWVLRGTVVAGGAAEEQALGQSSVLLYPFHAGWTLRRHLCQLSSFQAQIKSKLWLLKLEHFWALYLRSLLFNVKGKHNRKSRFLLPDVSGCFYVCWGSMVSSRDTSCQWNITSESPYGKSFEPEFSFPMMRKRNIFLTNVDNFTGTICNCVWMKHEKIPLWSFPTESHIASLSPCPLTIIMPLVKEP